MNFGKYNWISLALLAMILASTVWDHFDRAKMNQIVSDVCLLGLKTGDLEQRAQFLQIELLASDGNQPSPAATLKSVAAMAHKAQQSPTAMDKAFASYAECMKTAKR